MIFNLTPLEETVAGQELIQFADGKKDLKKVFNREFCKRLKQAGDKGS